MQADPHLSPYVPHKPYPQIAKLLIIPFTCGVELVWLKRTFTPAVIGSIVAVIMGVGVV